MRIIRAIQYDLLFQFRHGFYYAYGLVTVLYIVLLRLIPPVSREFVTTFIIFSDPAVLGAFFIGGIILLEKGQRVLQHLFITPITIEEYILAKTISLTTLALISSLAIVIVTFGYKFNAVLLIIAVSLSSVFFTLAGMLLAVRVKTVNEYLFKSPVYFTALFLPLLALLNIYKTPVFYIFPTNAALILTKAAFNHLPLIEITFAIIILLIWVILAFILAKGQIRKYIISKNGGA